MNGRVEKDTKIFKNIETKLVSYPEFVASWYYYLKANNKTATSCSDFINKLTRFLEFINEDISVIVPEDFNENIITQYFLKVQTKEDGTEMSKSYRQGIWSCLNNFFNFMYTRKLIPDNYFVLADIKRQKGNDLNEINKHRKLLTQDDFRRILAAVDTGVGSAKAKGYQKKYKNRDKAILLLFMSTGMRKTALEEINVSDINFEKHELYTIDKGHKVFTYYLTSEVLEIIDKWLTDRYFLLGREDKGALFISQEGTRMHGKSIARVVDKYAYEALGYHISPHKLRSGFGSILYEQKHDIEYVRRAMGHSQVTTTQRYIVTNNDEQKTAASMISGMLF